NADDFYVTANLVGVALRCVVDPQWPCEALVGAAAEAYHAEFPQGEVPECNVVFHTKHQEFLVGGAPIGASCACGDELELGVALTGARGNGDPTPSITSSSINGDGETSEFCVLFHKLPLGFTMKRGQDSSTEVGTIYPKSSATHFLRLAPGVAIVRIAGTPIAELGLRQVHDLIKNAELPLEIHFRGPELIVSPTLSPEPTPQRSQLPPSRLPAPSVVKTPTQQQQPQARDRNESFDRRSVRSNGSSRSRGSRGSGRGKKKGGIQQQGPDNQQGGGGKPRIQAASAGSEPDESNQRGPEEQDAMAETALIEHIEQLKVALLRKHEEAKQIARQLELYTEKLVAVRAATSSSNPRQQQQTKQNGSGGPRTRRAVTTPSASSGAAKVRLTPEILEAMDKKSGLPRRGTGAYTSSNVSSISGYSARSTPAPRTVNMRVPRSARALLANVDNVSVSSYTSHSSQTSGRGGGNRSPRATALKNLNKRYNYMPQKYAASATGAPEAASTSLSSRGAVMSRARISRDSFITKSESPGVGYYDVHVKDRVKGGEIGDSDRSLHWS
ncbi:hypothetical protein BBJ28_00007979, partial [Nothophytophthora sp. Chile5]